MTAKRQTKVTQITVRGLDPNVVERLKQRARLAGRSMEEEARLALTKGAEIDREELMERARKLAAEIGNQGFSVDMITESRRERDRHFDEMMGRENPGHDPYYDDEPS